jgi:hypothetical protein
MNNSMKQEIKSLSARPESLLEATEYENEELMLGVCVNWDDMEETRLAPAVAHIEPVLEQLGSFVLLGRKMAVFS